MCLFNALDLSLGILNGLVIVQQGPVARLGRRLRVIVVEHVERFAVFVLDAMPKAGY